MATPPDLKDVFASAHEHAERTAAASDGRHQSEVGSGNDDGVGGAQSVTTATTVSSVLLRHGIMPDYRRRTVTNLTVKALDPTDQGAVDDVLSLAAKRRSTGSTDMNATSSRSHSVFSLELLATSPGGQAVRGRLHLCDLAGSERLDRSNATGVAASETRSINKSLSSLADVFTAIGQRASFVPFRNSKLTYLLQPALSGSGKMCMFVNVSPTEASVQESLCSLRFATKVNKCELGKAMRTVEATASSKTGGAAKRGYDAGCGGRPNSSSGGRSVKRKA